MKPSGVCGVTWTESNKGPLWPASAVSLTAGVGMSFAQGWGLWGWLPGRNKGQYPKAAGLAWCLWGAIGLWAPLPPPPFIHSGQLSRPQGPLLF